MRTSSPAIKFHSTSNGGDGGAHSHDSGRSERESTAGHEAVADLRVIMTISLFSIP